MVKQKKTWHCNYTNMTEELNWLKEHLSGPVIRGQTQQWLDVTALREHSPPPPSKHDITKSLCHKNSFSAPLPWLYKSLEHHLRQSGARFTSLPRATFFHLSLFTQNSISMRLLALLSNLTLLLISSSPQRLGKWNFVPLYVSNVPLSWY